VVERKTLDIIKVIFIFAPRLLWKRQLPEKLCFEPLASTILVFRFSFFLLKLLF